MAHGPGTELRIRLFPTPVGEHTRPMDYNIMQHLKGEALTERQRRTILSHYHQRIAHISPNTTSWPLLTRSKMAKASSALTSQPQYSRTEALRGALRIPGTGSLRSSTDRPAEPCRSVGLDYSLLSRYLRSLPSKRKKPAQNEPEGHAWPKQGSSEYRKIGHMSC